MKYFKAEVEGGTAYIPYDKIESVELLIPDAEKPGYGKGDSTTMKPVDADEFMRWLDRVIHQLDLYRKLQIERKSIIAFPIGSVHLSVSVDVTFYHCGDLCVTALDDDEAHNFLMNNKILDYCDYDGDPIETFTAFMIAMEDMNFADAMEEDAPECEDAPDEERDAILEQLKADDEDEVQAMIDAEEGQRIMQEEATQDVLDEEARQEAPVEDEEPLDAESLEAFNQSMEKDD